MNIISENTNNTILNINEKIEASIMLGSYLDTIGFKDGKWEFNYYKNIVNIDKAKESWLDIINEYYSLGGPDINIKNWKSSDDTILMIATGNAILNGGGVNNYINEYLNIFDDLKNDIRCAGYQTILSLNLIKNISNKNLYNENKIDYLSQIPVSQLMGGNGAAIRTSIIGIIWYNNEDKIISESISASRITHNLPLGFLGGLVTALFTSYAIKNISPFEWLPKLINLYKSKKIHNYINKTNLKFNYDNEINNYFLYWFKYQEERLSKMQFRSNTIFTFPDARLRDLLNYSPEYIDKYIKKEDFQYYKIGSTGIDAVIWAYDSLLLSIIPNCTNNYIDFDNIDYSFNSLLFYSTINIGDGDSIGIIAGCWYGALNGFKGIDKIKMKNLEFYDKLNNLSKKLIKLYI